MRNAPRAVVRLGFEIYISSNPRLPLDQINATLEAQGQPAVAERTFKHYQKLDRYGQRTYIPINRFDVMMGNPDTN
jgi:hypothetical protein